MRKLNYLLNLTDEQKKFIDNTIIAYNILYNIFARHMNDTEEKVRERVDKYLGRCRESFPFDRKAAEEYWQKSLLPKFQDNYPFHYREKRYRNGHYERFDIDGIKVSDKGLYIPEIGQIQAFIHKRCNDIFLKSVRFDRVYKNGMYKYYATVKYNIEHIEDGGYISEKFFRFGQDKKIFVK